MPELPEVETVRSGLEPAMQGRTITEVQLNRPNLRFPFPEQFGERISGARVERLTRRAKYILAELDNGNTIIMHLGMTGRFSVFSNNHLTHNLGEFYYLSASDKAGAGAHDHVVFTLDDDTRIVYTDPRRFGIMDLCATKNLDDHKLLAGLGVEPLGNELHAQYLKERLAGRRMPLKAALLDQRIIAGLGNIYVCEALNRAQLSPKRLAGTLARGRKIDPRLERLVAEVRSVLREAIDAGGSTLRDYATTDGSSGEFQQRFCVYDREGQACLQNHCKGIVRRIVQSGRSTFYCPRCQR